MPKNNDGDIPGCLLCLLVAAVLLFFPLMAAYVSYTEGWAAFHKGVSIKDTPRGTWSYWWTRGHIAAKNETK